ncbi:MAG: type II toxin-antitoxin system VapC family toxin [Limisphaerales bacterium]
MNLLLDTQAFLWLDSDQARVRASTRRICFNEENVLWLSVVSIWEMQIKIAIGKMRMRCPLSELISDQEEINSLQILPLQLPHPLELQNLPAHHKDPEFKLYPVQVI